MAVARKKERRVEQVTYTWEPRTILELDSNEVEAIEFYAKKINRDQVSAEVMRGDLDPTSLRASMGRVLDALAAV